VRIVPVEEFRDCAGAELGPSDWCRVDQERIDRFAEATQDRQFIHVDPERAAATPFGGTIAHGYMTLSLLTHLNHQHALAPEGIVMGVNYGSDKVRYLQPVRSGSRVRSRSRVLSVTEKSPGQWLVKSAVTVEIENEDKPALYAEILSLLITG
jgi:acyl dehydratase